MKGCLLVVNSLNWWISSWALLLFLPKKRKWICNCWKYVVDANFEHFEWNIYIPGGVWTHVSTITEWCTYEACLPSWPQEHWYKQYTKTIYRSLKSQSTHPLLFKPHVLSEFEFTYIHSLDPYTSPVETHPGSEMADKHT